MNFQKTRIYGRALELVTLSQSVIDDLPRGHAFLADQLRRAALLLLLIIGVLLVL